ncbi:MAG: phosphate ABC transporter ATP-binding protein [Anaerolineales bacterium]|nr:phosphate ABC transporter ATP-binding protein [Anaerolineales bacterium]
MTAQANLATMNGLATRDNLALELHDLTVFYGEHRAVAGVNMAVQKSKITAYIGPSGCGKSTVLRSINRMNDLIPGARVEGEVLYHGNNLYAMGVDPVEVRRRIGMVFQKPNPFPKSIFDNVAYGPRLLGIRDKNVLTEIVETSLRAAVLWDEVKNDLKKSGLALSGGQQQRLCIARALATQPDLILMDEPCSALDPISTLRIEELMQELSSRYTIVLVTHNMQQAARVSHMTAFFLANETRTGTLIEYGQTTDMFTKPKDKRTEDYISGRFG